ncbi:hypothetical protein LEP1GSC058_2339 [Leptospira fainei serovar Hurstbridge str. BUT 6]|uniref:Yip1 domain protein n=2 Tax=Leptospira fainei serovar Hurstbridge str. BUT 6 TaxID=1193011 RepID=S3V3R8_9LEPT|nr:hypothetical protein [Leptospira fainei]EPG75299.1 hypothetical protein LEP1GSC058_2339 [Leptospira fainei serovar Hurstbridge str. BUT 6]
MLTGISFKIKETIWNQLSEIRDFIQEKKDIESWTDFQLLEGLKRYAFGFGLASFINIVLILIGIYANGSDKNALIENLYAQKEIGGLLYFFSHFPQNIFGFIFLWGFLPILVASLWYLAFIILNGKEKEASKPTLTLLSLNSLFIPLTGIVVQEIFSF